MTEPVRLGVQNLCVDPSPVRGWRAGLLTNAAATMPDLTRNIEALLGAGVNLVALLGPEHGLSGVGQAGESEPEGHDVRTGLPLFDTYARRHGLGELFAQAGIEAVVFDMQDVGSRFYTYVWSLYDAMCAAAQAGIAVVVLDRPNPLGGEVSAGPALSPAAASFVGRVDVPMRHGSTAGELAQEFNDVWLPRAVGTSVELHVVPLSGWRRAMGFERTGLPWVPPSPNIPTVDTAFAFAGAGLIEGTNLSEGRGTAEPFRLIGAPYADAGYVDALRAAQLPGVGWQEVEFRPTFHKHAGESVHGVRMMIMDREVYDAARTGVTLIRTAAELYPGDFAFREAREAGGVAPMDLLWGSPALRTAIGAGTVPDWPDPAPDRSQFWLYD